MRNRLVLVISLLISMVSSAAFAQGTRILEIKIIDPKGQPVSGVSLKMNGYVGGKQVHDSGSTDAGGMASLIIGSNAPADYLYVSATKAGIVPKRLSWRKGGDVKDSVPASYTMTMEPGSKIGGVVVDDSDKPVGGATVVLMIHSKERDAVESVNVSYESVKADDGGKWSYPLAPSKFDAAEVGAWDHDCDITGGYFPMEDYTPVSALQDQTAKVKLTRGQQVDGVVYDSAGKPLAKADVCVGGDRVASNVIPPVKTDADGKFHFGAKSGAEVIITVKAPKHAPSMEQFVMGAEPKHIDFHLTAGKTLEGTVVDSAGKPIAGVTLFADTWRGHRTINQRLTTDSNGHFSWAGAPEDDVMMDIMKQGYGELRQHAMRPATQPIVVTLGSPLKVSGSVVDAETGKPVENFRVIQGIVFNENQVSWQRDDNRAKVRPGGKFEFEQTYPYPGYKIRIESDNYLPSESRVYKLDEKKVDLEFKLKKGEGLGGVVKGADGKPVEGADVLLATSGNQVQIQNGAKSKYDRDSVSTKTDVAGKFSLPPQGESEKFQIIVLSDAGEATVSRDEFTKAKGEIVLAPWGKIEGMMKIGSKPAGNAQVTMWSMDDMSGRMMGGRNDAPRVYKQYQTTSDGNGHYAFDRVFAGKYGAARQVQLGANMFGGTNSTTVEVKAGQTATADIGGKGRPVVGRLALPADLPQGWVAQQASVMTKVDVPRPTLPTSFAAMSNEEKQAWYKKWMTTDEGKAYVAKMQAATASRRNYSFQVASDGAFRVDDVEPGSYTVNITVAKPGNGRSMMGEPIGSAGKQFEVAAIPGGQSDEALDIGTLDLKIMKNVSIGQMAPEFETKTLDGKPLKLSDFKGKYVLLDFWATWCGPCVAEMPHIKETYDKFGGNAKFAMISLSLDNATKEPIAFAEKNGMKWTQAFLGEWSKDKVTPMYGIQGIPSLWLIDPSGKVVAKDMRGDVIKDTVGQALGQ